MSNSGSTYSMQGTGIRYNPRARSPVTPTQAPEQRSITEDSQTGTDDPYDPKNELTPKELDEQKTALEALERRHEANQQRGQSSNKSTRTIRSDPTDFHEESRTDDSQTGTDDPYDAKKLLTPEELDEQIAALEAIERHLQANQRRGQSSNSGTIPIRSAPTEFREDEFDVVSGDGRIQKAAGGDYHHTPASQLDRGIGAGAHGNQYQQVGNAGGQCIFQQLRNSDQ